MFLVQEKMVRPVRPCCKGFLPYYGSCARTRAAKNPGSEVTELSVARYFPDPGPRMIRHRIETLSVSRASPDGHPSRAYRASLRRIRQAAKGSNQPLPP